MVASKKQVKAVARTIRISPQKLNLVAETIRGLKVDKALAQLTFSRKRVAGEVKKLLTGAIANAENNFGMDIDNLVVAEAYVGKAMVMKRWHAAAKGSGHRILKPFSNMTIVVKEAEKEVKKESKKETEKSPAKKATKKETTQKEAK